MSVIIIVLPRLEDAKKIRKILISHGFENTIACSTGAAVLGEVNKYSGGLIISGYRLSDMYYTELTEYLNDFYELLLMGSASTVSSQAAGIMAITMPVKIYDLVNTVDFMIRQIDRRIKKERKKLKKRSEQEENYIKNAKLLLMERNHLSEEDAYRYIQKCSMDNATNMVETAQMILTLMYDEG